MRDTHTKLRDLQDTLTIDREVLTLYQAQLDQLTQLVEEVEEEIEFNENEIQLMINNDPIKEWEYKQYLKSKTIALPQQIFKALALNDIISEKHKELAIRLQYDNHILMPTSLFPQTTNHPKQKLSTKQLKQWREIAPQCSVRAYKIPLFLVEY